MKKAIPQMIEEAGGMQNRNGGFHGKFIPRFLSSVFSWKPVRKRLAEVQASGCIRLLWFSPAGFAA
jgi:hypothetical protein